MQMRFEMLSPSCKHSHSSGQLDMWSERCIVGSVARISSGRMATSRPLAVFFSTLASSFYIAQTHALGSNCKKLWRKKQKHDGRHLTWPTLQSNPGAESSSAAPPIAPLKDSSILAFSQLHWRTLAFNTWQQKQWTQLNFVSNLLKNTGGHTKALFTPGLVRLRLSIRTDFCCLAVYTGCVSPDRWLKTKSGTTAQYYRFVVKKI